LGVARDLSPVARKTFPVAVIDNLRLRMTRMMWTAV